MDQNSRYHTLDKARYTMPNGREVTYWRRRFVPAPDSMQTLSHVTMADGDRLDIVTARSLGDPEQYWRVCDANGVLRPEALERVNRRVRIPIPKV